MENIWIILYQLSLDAGEVLEWPVLGEPSCMQKMGYIYYSK